MNGALCANEFGFRLRPGLAIKPAASLVCLIGARIGVQLCRWSHLCLKPRSCAAVNASRMRFEWDPNKSPANRRKHGISFEAAAACSMIQTTFLSRTGVRRRRGAVATLGLVRGVVVLMVAPTLTVDGGEESFE